MQILICKCILGIMLTICGYTDFKKQNIYNFVTLPTIGLGLLVNCYFGGVSGLESSLIGLVIIAIIGYAIVYFRWLGYGDWKMLIAIAALMGIYYTLALFFIASLVSAFWAIYVITKKKTNSVPLGSCMFVAFIGYEILRVVFA